MLDGINLPDIVIMIVIGASVLKGAYEGFATASINFVLLVISAFVSVLLSPSLASSLLVNSNVAKTLLYYTEDISRIDTVEHAKMAVSQLSGGELTAIVENSTLPKPFGALLEQNMIGRAFESLQQYTVEEYFNTTIVHTIINMFSLFLLFAIIYAIFSFLLAGVNYSVRMPTLVHGDAVAGAVVGFVRGVCLCYMIFFLLPIVQVSLSSVSLVDAQIQASKWLPIFVRDNFLWSFVKGVVA